MPVGRRELERWSQKQQQKNSGSGAAMEGLIRGAHQSGALNLTGKGLAQVPAELLDWHTPIGDENWWDVVELRKLDLSHNAFTALPEELFLPLSELATLHVGNNQLEALPASLSKISETLARVNLQRNNLHALPPALCNCLRLVYLNVDHNALDQLPEALGSMLCLQTLSAAHNQLRALPASIGGCRALTQAVLASNELTALPASIGRLSSLEDLSIAHNRLERLPDSMRDLSLLVRLDARENKLAEPPVLPRSSRLAEVLLGFNRLQVLPADIASAAPELSVLDVRDNQIGHLDMAALLPLKKLKTLDLRNNEVGKLPPLLGVMTSITALLLEGNPLKTMRRTMIDASAREILDYLRGRMGDEDFAALAAAGSKAGGGARAGGRALEGGLADEVTDAVRGAMSLDARLDLRHKGLHVIPEETASLTSLRSADFSDNRISSLPLWAPHVWGGTLRELNLSRNPIGRAGGGAGGLDVLGGLRSLTALIMQRNELAVVPEAIEALENLEVLDLSQNLVTSLDNLRVSPTILFIIFQF